ncbi:MAG: hypothetical protein PHX61_04865 [Alphaproteobacteria bacterium]|nr:hypothetical protein [Alphaproteobacteria bacterium]
MTIDSATERRVAIQKVVDWIASPLPRNLRETATSLVWRKKRLASPLPRNLRETATRSDTTDTSTMSPLPRNLRETATDQEITCWNNSEISCPCNYKIN